VEIGGENPFYWWEGRGGKDSERFLSIQFSLNSTRKPKKYARKRENPETGVAEGTTIARMKYIYSKREGDGEQVHWVRGGFREAEDTIKKDYLAKRSCLGKKVEAEKTRVCPPDRDKESISLNKNKKFN